MKKYSVIQIADILDTNPETVRRWIRDNKLVAEQESRKQGNAVTEAALQDFLKATPKYAARYAAKQTTVPTCVEVKVVPAVPHQEQRRRSRAGVLKQRTVFEDAMLPASREITLTPGIVGAAKSQPKGLKIVRLEAEMERLQKEVTLLDRTLKSLKAEARGVRSVGLKKK